MKIITIVLAIVSLAGFTVAQPLYVYQHGSPSFGSIIDLRGLPDGSAIVLTYSRHSGTSSPSLIKVRPDGSIEWKKNIICSKPIFGGNIALTADGDILYTANPASFSSGYTVVCRLGADGTLKKSLITQSPVAIMNTHIFECSDSTIVLYGTLVGDVSEVFILSLYPDLTAKQLGRYTPPIGFAMDDPLVVEGEQHSLLLFVDNTDALRILKIAPDATIDTQYAYSLGSQIITLNSIARHSSGTIIASARQIGSTNAPPRQSIFLSFSPSGELQQLREYDNLIEVTSSSIDEADDKTILLSSFGTGKVTAQIFKIDLSGTVQSVSEFTASAKGIPLILSLARRGSNGTTLFATATQEYLHGSESYSDGYLVRADASLQACRLQNTLVSSIALKPKPTKPISIKTTDFSLLGSPGTTIAIESDTSITAGTNLCASDNVAPSSSLPTLPMAVLVTSPVYDHTPLILRFTQVPSGYYDVVMRDLTGKVIVRTNTELHAGEELHIPVAALPSGLYTIELVETNSQTSVWREKVIVR